MRHSKETVFFISFLIVDAKLYLLLFMIYDYLDFIFPGGICNS